jgi:hypothetical protein
MLLIIGFAMFIFGTTMGAIFLLLPPGNDYNRIDEYDNLIRGIAAFVLYLVGMSSIALHLFLFGV